MARPIFEQNCEKTVAAFREGLSEDQPVKPLWKTLRKLFGYPMLSIMLLLILFGTCVLGSIIAHYLEHSHLAH